MVPIDARAGSGRFAVQSRDVVPIEDSEVKEMKWRILVGISSLLFAGVYGLLFWVLLEIFHRRGFAVSRWFHVQLFALAIFFGLIENTQRRSFDFVTSRGLSDLLLKMSIVVLLFKISKSQSDELAQ